MNFFEKILHFLQAPSPVPAIYGIYHIICLLLVISLTVFLSLRFRDAEEATVRRIMLTVWILMVVAEIYKQLEFSMEVVDGVASWDYSWYAFPYQFCSTPIYVLPFAIFMKKGRVHDAAVAFLMTFALFGGLVVMIYPGDVFTGTLGINFQTMLHHGLQVVLGIYLAVHERRRLGFSHFLTSLPVFLAVAIVALLLNITVYHALRAGGGEIPTFNMFFISPYFECTLPLVSLIYPLVPYPVFLLIYLIGFSLAALIVYYAIVGIKTLVLRRLCRAEG